MFCVFGCVFGSQHFDEAETYYTKAIKIIERVDGKGTNHATFCNNLGNLLLRTGHNEQALVMLSQCESLFSKLLDEGSSSLLNVRGNVQICRMALADDNNSVQESEQARQTVKRILEKLKSQPFSLGEEHPWVAKFSEALRAHEEKTNAKQLMLQQASQAQPFAPMAMLHNVPMMQYAV